MRVHRLPLAIGGVLVNLCFFALLASLIDNPIEYSRAIELPTVEFSPVNRPPPPVEPPRPIKPQRETVTEVIGTKVIDDAEPGNKGSLEPYGLPELGHGHGIDLGLALMPGADGDSIPLVRMDPMYPRRAEIRGIEGWVRVQFTITENGSVRDPVVVASNPAGEFDEAALDAVARWRYRPRVTGGVAVERVGVQTMFEFKLNE